MSEQVKPEKATIDRVTRELLEHASLEEVSTIWHRFSQQQPQCGYGLLGLCCRNCLVGPCRVDPFGVGPSAGSCGVDADIIVSRNLARHVAAGLSSYTNLTCELLEYLKAVAEGRCRALSIVNKDRLLELASVLGVQAEGKSDEELAREVLTKLCYELGKPTDEPSEVALRGAPRYLIETWSKIGTLPRSPMREITDALHKTHVGVSLDPDDLLLTCLRLGAAAVWISAYLAYAIQDVLAGTPSPRKGPIGPRTISEDYVNIVARIAKRPVLRKLIEIAKSKEMEQEAMNVNAIGVNVLSPANYVMTELALSTGMVELFVVDYQCTLYGATLLHEKYHTKTVTTSKVAKVRGAVHVEVTPENLEEKLREIAKIAIENFKNRKEEKMFTPRTPPETAMVGWSAEALRSQLKGDLTPLVDALREGKVKGIAIVFGCTNPKIVHHKGHVEVTKGLIKNDILVMGTGCWNIAAGLAGLLKPEARSLAGPGLSKFCEEHGIPPCLSFGGCADNARIIRLVAELAERAGTTLQKFPVVASTPEVMAEEIVAQIFGLLASGVPVHVGVHLPVLGSRYVTEWLTRRLESLTGARLLMEPDPERAVRELVAIVGERRRLAGWS